MTISKRIHFTGHLEVIMSNPNGDPDMDGAPRIDEHGHGEISGVAIKRRARDGMEQLFEEPLFIRAGSVLNDTISDAVKAAGKGGDLATQLCGQFIDMRLFGGVISTGEGGGAANLRGPVQIGPAVSLEPITVQELGITRCAATKGGKERNQQQGRQYLVGYGVYRFDGTVSPADAAKTGMSEDDFEKLLQGLLRGWDLTKAATRTEVNVRSLTIHRHASKFGDESDRASMDRVHVSLPEDRWAGRRGWADYSYAIDDSGLSDGASIVELVPQPARLQVSA